MEWVNVQDVIENGSDNFENCIYMWKNKVNEKLYVGQAKDFRKRTREHKYASFNENRKYSYNVPLHKAIRKYGLENFEICILEFDLNDFDEMNQKEIFYIEKFDTLANNGKGYNVASGGGNTNPLAGKTGEEMKEISKKMSEALKGRQFSEKHKQNLSEAKKGEKAHQIKKVICITNGEIFDYIKQAEEKCGVDDGSISACCKGKLKSAGVIDGKPAVWMYYSDYEKLSEEEVKKIKNEEAPNGTRPKVVICITTGKIYGSTCEAERQTGVAHQSIAACCRGKQKSAGVIDGKPAIWMCLEDYQKFSEEEITKIKNEEVSNRPKVVICITTGKIYESTHEAGRQTEVAQTSISACCRRKLKSAGKDENGNKLVWMYYEDYLKLTQEQIDEI